MRKTGQRNGTEDQCLEKAGIAGDKNDRRKKLNEEGKSRNEFNQINKNDWKGRIILGFMFCFVLLLMMHLG